jgi:hypothetical protein
MYSEGQLGSEKIKVKIGECPEFSEFSSRIFL